MTSGTFKSIPLESITIDRATRQRRELPGIPILAESIQRLGLINPITVTRDLVLVAGERRYTACKSLGWSSIPAQFIEDLDPSALRAIELEENIKRVDLPWQDQVRAIQEYHSFQRSQRPDWVQASTADALGIAQAEVSEKLMVADELTKGNPRVVEAPKYSVAKGIVLRDRERAGASEVAKLSTVLSTTSTTVAGTTIAPVKAVLPASADDGSDTIINADFNSWAPTYSGPKFNLIHCDFPYGIGAGDFAQSSASAHGGYEDSADTYWTLCRTLAANLDRLASESCHLIFWFSLTHYQSTLDFLTTETDFVVNPFPLIWLKSDNAGILPDPARGPRRIYETAFFASRGDRKIVQAVANAYAAPTVRDRHMSEKPTPVLGHFFRMVADHHTLLLDPTAGSGSSIRAAEAAGVKHALGLELNPEYVTRARLALVQDRKLRKAAK